MAYNLSIEPTNAPVFLYGFHLGTDIELAKKIAEEKFHARNKYGYHTRSVALLWNREVIGTYDGEWSYNAAARHGSPEYTEVRLPANYARVACKNALTEF